MKCTRLFGYALLSLMVGASTAAYAQGEKGKKEDPQGAAKQGDQPHAKTPPGQDKKSAPPAHAQPAAQQHQRSQASPPPARERTSPRPAAQPASIQRQRGQQASPSEVQRQRVQQSSPSAVQRQRVQQSPTRLPNPASPVARARTSAPPAYLPASVQRQRAQTEQQRATQYRQRLDQQVRFSQQRAAQMQQQRRINEYRAQQQYLAQLRAQQLSLQTARNYSNDPYIRTAPSYRYAYSGTSRETNQYGADVLRQAVNYGYQEGARFGQADRQDGLPSNYRNSFAYQDANYGYSGYYVDQADYNYYFRQGFQRGYSDGYNSQSQYGTSLNGSPSILATLLSNILGLTSLR
jgi:hypothetical protein